jgi:PKD repeat protein
MFVSESLLNAQPVLKIDTVYLPDQSIKKVRISHNGEVWFMTAGTTPGIFRISRDGTLQDRSAEFAHLISLGITDFVCPDTNEIIVGTDSNFIFHYRNGFFKNRSTDLGLGQNENHINSLYLTREILRENAITWADRVRFGVTTNGNAYESISLDSNLVPIYCSNLNNRKFLSKNDAFLLDGPVPELCASMNMWWPVYDTNEYGKVLCGNINYYQSGSILHSWLGFEKGYVIRSYYGYFRYLNSQAVYAMADYDFNYILMAADSGIYYSNTWQDPHWLNIGMENFTAYDVEVWQGNIYAATSKGLIKLINKTCDDFKVSFGQNEQYIAVEDKKAFSFEPLLYGGTLNCHWDFGDGSFSDALFPSHTYNSPGNYRIALTATNGTCTDSASSIAVVYQRQKHNDVFFEKKYRFPDDGYANSTSMINIADLDGNEIADIFLPPVSLIRINSNDSTLFEQIKLVPDSVYGNPFNYWLNNSLIGDMNNDGLNDIVGGTRIFINKGNFKFDVISIDHNSLLQTAAQNLLDYNNDGLTDIAFGNGNKFQIYLNKGSFRFEKVYEFFGDGEINDIKWLDIDSDDDNDIVLSGLASYYVFINDSGKYDISEKKFFNGLALSKIFPADLNNDRKTDYYLLSGYSNFLFTGTKDLPEQYNDTWLTNERSPFEFNNQIRAFNVVYADLDNNGFADCLKNTLDNKSSRIFMNQGGLIFRNDSLTPFNDSEILRVEMVAVADITSDGKTDILFSKANDYSAEDYVFINKTQSDNHWIKIHCFGSKSNINAIGSKVAVKAKMHNNDSWQFRTIEASAGQNVQNGYEIHFGLGDAVIADSLEILWTSGERSIFTGLSCDKVYSIIEPVIHYQGDTSICENVRPVFHLPFVKNVGYEWLRDGSAITGDMNDLKVKLPGQYKCIMHYPDFDDTTSVIHINHKAVSKSEIWFVADSIFCPGDSVLVHSLTYPGATCQWMSGGIIAENQNNFSLYCNKALPLQQLVTNELGCTDTSNILNPALFPVPVITYGQTELCEGDSVQIILQTDFASYLWSNGSTGYSSWLHDNELLWVIVQNEYGCSQTDTIKYAVWPKPDSDAGEDVTIGFSDTHTIINCYSDPHTYYWNDTLGMCSKTFYGRDLNIGNHQVTLTIISSHNCSSSDTADIEVVLSTKEPQLNDRNLFVFPNPALDYTWLYLNGNLNSENTQVDIFDSAGNLVNRTRINAPVSTVVPLDLSGLQKGIYIIKITANGKSELTKLLVNRN